MTHLPKECYCHALSNGIRCVPCQERLYRAITAQSFTTGTVQAGPFTAALSDSQLTSVQSTILGFRLELERLREEVRELRAWRKTSDGTHPCHCGERKIGPKTRSYLDDRGTLHQIEGCRQHDPAPKFVNVYAPEKKGCTQHRPCCWARGLRRNYSACDTVEFRTCACHEGKP